MKLKTLYLRLILLFILSVCIYSILTKPIDTNAHIQKFPIIIIPGFLGTELHVQQENNWSQPDGHGGIFEHYYENYEKVWVNFDKAAEPGNDDYFDVIRLHPDGETEEVDLYPGSAIEGTYKPLLDLFTSNGYTLDRDLYIFPYDWRKDIRSHVTALDELINTAIARTGKPEVHIIAHSMGGLIATEYVAQQPQDKVGRLVTLGTPYLGAAEFTKYLLYGGCVKFQLGPICLSLSTDEVKDIIQNFQSGYQLAPSKKYYDFYKANDTFHPRPFKDDRDIDSNGVTGELNYDQLKSLLTNLGYNTTLFEKAEEFHQLDQKLGKLNTVTHTLIVGSGIETIGQVVEYKGLGVPGFQPNKKDLVYINGDKTVPLFSASLNDVAGQESIPNVNDVYYVKSEHANLPTNPIAHEILNWLFINPTSPPPISASRTPIPLEGRSLLSVHSPIEIHLYDENGSHTGITAEGNFETNIPNTNYETLDDSKFIWIPTSGNYSIKFKATDTGSFDFKIKKFDDNKVVQTVLYNNIPITTETTAEAFINSNIPPILQVDQDGNGTVDSQVQPTSIESDDTVAPTTQVNIKGTLGTNNWYTSNVTVELTAEDNPEGSGVKNIYYSINNSQPNSYTAPFTITNEGLTTLQIWSQDKNDNTEFKQEKTIKIDKTAPELYTQYNLETDTVSIQGIDNQTSTNINETINNSETKITDEAGNETKILWKAKDKKKKDTLQLLKISYNKNTPILLSENKMTVKIQKDKTNIIKELVQEIELQEKQIRAEYKDNKNTTLITIKQKGEEKQKIETQGISLLKIYTLKGTLKTNY